MRKYKKSEIFWNIVATILIIATVLISSKLFFIVQCIITFAFAIIGFINSGQREEYKIHIPLFLWVNFIGVSILLSYLLIEFIVLIYKFPIKWVLNNPIKKFNNWLDTENEKKMKFKEFTKKEN